MAELVKKLETTAEIDLMENAVYIVKDRQIVKAPAPEKRYGALTIKWQGGKPSHGKMEESFRL